MTNLGKTREEIIYEILLSLTKGNVGSIDAVYRVNRAIEYYKELKRKEIVYEIEDKLDEKELHLVEFSDTTGDEIMYVDGVEALGHKTLYPTDVLDALDGLGIINFKRD